MSSEAKKMRMEDVNSFENYDKRRLCMTILGLCASAYNTEVTLTPLKIKNCNAASSDGARFSEAFCDTEAYDEGIVFGDVFHIGIKILKDFVRNGTVPDKRPMFLAFQKLLNFLNGEKCIKFNDPQSLHSLSETEHTILVANHLLAQLATSSCYVVDQNSFAGQRGDGCVCGVDSCRMTGDYGDTSIGNLKVWHGNLDVIINNDLAVESVENPPESPGGKSAVETNLQRNSQIIAQTIVFSFLKAKRHPELEHFLTPCIGIGNSELIILFYDCEHDVLLESSCVPLFEDQYSCKFSYSSILACWLAVNYKTLCSGLVEEFKICKSNFFSLASEKINIYREELKFQNVNSFQTNELKLVKAASKVKTTPLMHETEATILEVLLSLALKDENFNIASGPTS